MGKMAWKGSDFAYNETNANYRKFFPANGFPFLDGDEAASVRALKETPHRDAVAAAIDDWMSHEGDRELIARMNRILFAATGDYFREPAFLSDLHPGQRIGAIKEAIGKNASPAFIVRMAAFLTNSERIELFERGISLYPGDFWLWFVLAQAYSQ